MWSAFGQMYHPHPSAPPFPAPVLRHLIAKFGTTLGRMTFGQMYPHTPHSHTPPAPPLCVETSHGQIWYCYGQADLWSDIPPTPNSLMPPPQIDILWPSVSLLWVGCPLVRLFSIAFLICDDKSSSAKVVPWCSNTSD